MKLLVINTAGLAIGGITTNMYNYLSRIKDKSTKIDLVVTVLQDEVSVKRFQNIGCSLYYLPHRTKKPFLYMYKLYLLCKKNKYDIVHIHGNSHTSFHRFLHYQAPSLLPPDQDSPEERMRLILSPPAFAFQ